MARAMIPMSSPPVCDLIIKSWPRFSGLFQGQQCYRLKSAYRRTRQSRTADARRQDAKTELMIEAIGTSLVVLGVTLAVVLQALPIQITTTKGTQVSRGPWRHIVWALPVHMLSNIGNQLRLASGLTLVAGLICWLLPLGE